MLTYIQIIAAKPRAKAWNLSDSQGLYLVIQPNGSKLWRFNYRFLGKQKKLHLGGWPTISLTVDKIRWLLAKAYPVIGTIPIAQITPHEALAVLRKVEATGAYESARRMHSVLSRIFRYGVATVRCDKDVAADLRGAIAAPKVKHFAAITKPSEVGALLRAILPPCCPFALTEPRCSFCELGGQRGAWSALRSSVRRLRQSFGYRRQGAFCDCTSTSAAIFSLSTKGTRLLVTWSRKAREDGNLPKARAARACRSRRLRPAP
jgi:integrase